MTLKKILTPYLLRRFKRDVLKNLPKRKEVIVRVEMSQKQKDISKLLLKDSLELLASAEKNKNTNLKKVTSALTYLR